MTTKLKLGTTMRAIPIETADDREACAARRNRQMLAFAIGSLRDAKINLNEAEDTADLQKQVDDLIADIALRIAA